MKIFLDTEFYEHQPKAFRTQWVTDEADGSRGPSTALEPIPGANAVQLISLGAVREDGAEFYAENSEFDWGNVPGDHWLQENVRPHLWGRPPRDWEERSISPWAQAKAKGGAVGYFKPHVIADQFQVFATTILSGGGGRHEDPEFWGYFCDYDWVVLCGLYGRMIDLPPEFPMYCRDLKQEMDRIDLPGMALPAQPTSEHHALADARWVHSAYKLACVWDDEGEF